MRDVTGHSALHRRRFLKYSGALAAAGALSSSLAACSSGPQSTNDTGGGKGGKDATLTAVIGYGNDGSWDPTQTASAFAMAANNHIYEGLLDTDPISREPYAALATQVPGDLSGTSWKFTLRAGATFHDGKPVTADDVVFVFDRILDPKTQTPPDRRRPHRRARRDGRRRRRVRVREVDAGEGAGGRPAADVRHRALPRP
ncbi:ABC-type transporter, periplasmic subunit [Actinobacteria bacterium OK006]|nr:ABC-type transporter, periplasmic subunit [Actinobacteria bacterium OK006]